MTCNFCGKEFEFGSRPDGLPNGFGFELESGAIIPLCVDCLTESGKEIVKKRFFGRQNKQKVRKNDI